MKSATVAFLIALVCALASAQTLAREVDNCCFVNRHCMTDQEWLDGYQAFQRRDCPVSQPATPATALVSSPANQPINNCCFVDRHCATDQEWVDGYQAFQRRDCPVSQPATPATAPVSSLASQPINNCCFVNRQCTTDQEWVDGYNAFWFDSTCQGAAPGSPYETIIINSAGRRIPIRGNADARQAIAAGFYYVRDALGQRWWNYIEIIDDVRYLPGRCTRGYACSNRNSRVIHLDTRHPLSPWAVASTLIHEACHLWQVRENRHHGRDYSIPYHDRPWEWECQAKEREAGL